jgi:hypothetical protein
VRPGKVVKSSGNKPASVRQASHRIVNPGSAGVIPKIKHRGIKPAGRKRELNRLSPERLLNERDDAVP